MKDKVKQFIIDNYGDIEEVLLPKRVGVVPDRKLLTLDEMENLIEKFKDEIGDDMVGMFEMQFGKRNIDDKAWFYIDVDNWDFLYRLLTSKQSEEDAEYEKKYQEYCREFDNIGGSEWKLHS